MKTNATRCNMELTITLLTWRIWRAPNNASRWEVGFNLAFKVLNSGLPYKSRIQEGIFFFSRKLDLNLSKKKLVKYFTWNVALYGAENWTLWEVDQKYLGSFEMCWRRMEKISWTDRVRNGEVITKNQGGEEYLNVIPLQARCAREGG